MFGQRIKRKEDPGLLRGDGRFADDIQLPGMLHAHFVRSPLAHARVTGIDTAEALTLNGVVAIYTLVDLLPLGVDQVLVRTFHRNAQQPNQS